MDLLGLRQQAIRHHRGQRRPSIGGEHVVERQPGRRRGVGLQVRVEGIRPDGHAGDVVHVVDHQRPQLGRRCCGRDPVHLELGRVLAGDLRREQHGLATLGMSPQQHVGAGTGVVAEVAGGAHRVEHVAAFGRAEQVAVRAVRTHARVVGGGDHVAGVEQLVRALHQQERIGHHRRPALRLRAGRRVRPRHDGTPTFGCWAVGHDHGAGHTDVVAVQIGRVVQHPPRRGAVRGAEQALGPDDVAGLARRQRVGQRRERALGAVLDLVLDRLANLLCAGGARRPDEGDHGEQPHVAPGSSVRGQAGIAFGHPHSVPNGASRLLVGRHRQSLTTTARSDAR